MDTMSEVINGGAYGEKQNPSMTTDAAYKKFLDRMRCRRRRIQRINNKPPQSKAGNQKKSQSAVTVDTMSEVINGGEATEKQNPSDAAYKKFLDRMRLRRRQIQRINNLLPPQSVKEKLLISGVANHKSEKLYKETVPSLAKGNEPIVSSLGFYPPEVAFFKTFSLLNMPKTEKLYKETVPSLAKGNEPIVSSLGFYPAAFAFAKTFFLLNMPKTEKLYKETVPSLAKGNEPIVSSLDFYPAAFAFAMTFSLLNMPKVDMGSGTIIQPIKHEDVDPCEEQQRS